MIAASTPPMALIWWRGSLTAPALPAWATAPSSTPLPSNASTPAASDWWKPVAKPVTTSGIRQGAAMTDQSEQQMLAPRVMAKLMRRACQRGVLKLSCPRTIDFRMRPTAR